MTKPAIRTRHDRKAERAVAKAPAAGGLAALIAAPADVQHTATAAGDFAEIRHSAIRPDPANPRKLFDEDGLAELAASVAADGLLEPLIVREIEPDSFMLIAGERRWRAIGQAIFAGAWPTNRLVPVMIRKVGEHDARRLALVENLQRRDLNPIEEARALKALQDLTGVSAAQIGRDLGFTERWAQQRLSLLKLPEGLQARVDAGDMKVEDARQAAAMWDKLPEIQRTQIERGVSTVAEAKRWLDSQPEPLSDPAKLAFMELVEKCKAEPYKGASYLATLVAAEVLRGEGGERTGVKLDDPHGAYEELRKRQMIEYVQAVRVEGIETGESYISLGYYGTHYEGPKLCKPAFEDGTRARMLPVWRKEVFGELPADGYYSTPWLNNQVVEPTPEIRERIRAAREDREAREQRWKDDQARSAADRKVAEEKAKARVMAAAEAEVEIRSAAQLGGANLEMAVELAAKAAALKLPLFVHEDGTIVDANGLDVCDGAWDVDERPRRRLLVAIVNAAAGHETPAKAPVRMDPDAPPREEFVALVSRHLQGEQQVNGSGYAAMEPDQADRWANAALEAYLEEEECIYGEDEFDWSDGGALSLSHAIRRGEYRNDATADPNDALTREAFIDRVVDLLLERDDIDERVTAVDLATAALDRFLAKHELAFGDAGEDWELIQDDVYEDALEHLRDDGDITDPKLLALAGVKTSAA